MRADNICHAAARQEGRCNQLPTWEAAASIPQEIYPFFSAAIENATLKLQTFGI
jgi:hypothetical protein